VNFALPVFRVVVVRLLPEASRSQSVTDDHGTMFTVVLPRVTAV